MRKDFVKKKKNKNFFFYCKMCFDSIDTNAFGSCWCAVLPSVGIESILLISKAFCIEACHVFHLQKYYCLFWKSLAFE